MSWVETEAARRLGRVALSPAKGELTERVPLSVIERVREVAGRQRLTIAEIARRADRALSRAGGAGVVGLRKMEATTPERSAVLKVRGVSAALDGRLAAVLSWYLDAKDDGSAAAGPRMGRDECFQRPDGTLVYTGAMALPGA